MFIDLTLCARVSIVETLFRCAGRELVRNEVVSGVLSVQGSALPDQNLSRRAL